MAAFSAGSPKASQPIGFSTCESRTTTDEILCGATNGKFSPPAEGRELKLRKHIIDVKLNETQQHLLKGGF